MEQTIKNFRIRLLVYLNSIQHINQSREIALVNTNLQRSLSWLGESLKALGNKSPYVESENPASKTIESMPESTDISLMEERWTTIDATQTARVKSFRGAVEETISSLRNLVYDDTSTESGNIDFRGCIYQSFVSLKDVKIWLGWELGRIKKQQDGPIGSPAPLNLPL